MIKTISPIFLSRLALAFVFLYAAISSLADPLSWVGFFPAWVGASNYSLAFFSIGEGLLALWLISGKKGFYAAIAAAVVLAVIVLTNLESMIIVFRDVGLFLAALSLAVLEKKADNL